MTILLYLILLGGLLVFLSQSSYAYVIAKVDISTSERRVHCAHHTVHSVCGILVMLLARVLEICPRLHLFGHIHSSTGIHAGKYTAFSNGSVVDDSYTVVKCGNKLAF